MSKEYDYMTKVDLVPKRDAYSEPYMNVVYEGKDIGTIWLDPKKATVDCESQITGMSWECDSAIDAVSMLVDVYNETKGN